MAVLPQVPHRVSNGLPSVTLRLSGQVQTKPLESIVADSLFPARWGLQDWCVGVEVPDDSQGLHVAGNAPTDDVILDYEYVVIRSSLPPLVEARKTPVNLIMHEEYGGLVVWHIEQRDTGSHTYPGSILRIRIDPEPPSPLYD